MGKIAVFVDHPRCSIHGVNGIMDALMPHYQFKVFTKHDILYDDWYDNVDIVAVPGGLGDANTFHRVMKHHIPKIKDFIFNKNGKAIVFTVIIKWRKYVWYLNRIRIFHVDGNRC